MSDINSIKCDIQGIQGIHQRGGMTGMTLHHKYNFVKLVLA